MGCAVAWRDSVGSDLGSSSIPPHRCACAPVASISAASRCVLTSEAERRQGVGPGQRHRTTEISFAPPLRSSISTNRSTSPRVRPLLKYVTALPFTYS